MLERLPERFKTGRTARALTSPSAILLAGAGASAAILANAALPVAVAAGAAAWAARVAFALPRRRREEGIDPFALSEPWRSYVQRAISSHRRFQRAVGRTHAGPLRDRLSDVEDRIATAVRECWQVASRGDALHEAVTELDIESIRQELRQAERELASVSGRPDLEEAAAALRGQLASAERLRDVARSTSDRLRRLNAELDEAVARTIELSLKTGTGGTAALGSDVDTVVGELEALRQALDETGGAAPSTAS